MVLKGIDLDNCGSRDHLTYPLRKAIAIENVWPERFKDLDLHIESQLHWLIVAVSHMQDELWTWQGGEPLTLKKFERSSSLQALSRNVVQPPVHKKERPAGINLYP